jgi:hypothetical protein
MISRISGRSAPAPDNGKTLPRYPLHVGLTGSSGGVRAGNGSITDFAAQCDCGVAGGYPIPLVLVWQIV